MIESVTEVYLLILYSLVAFCIMGSLQKTKYRYLTHLFVFLVFGYVGADWFIMIFTGFGLYVWLTGQKLEDTSKDKQPQAACQKT